MDEIWGTDMTETITIAEGRAYVFIAVDHCSGAFVGTRAASGASRWEALEPIRQGVAKHFGSLEAGAAAGLVLRHDHGSNYMSDDFHCEIEFPGMTSSPAFVRQPEGNGVAERAIRTLKEQLLRVRHFATVEELRLALAGSAALYNASWLREGHGHNTPDQIRAEQIGLETEAATANWRNDQRKALSQVRAAILVGRDASTLYRELKRDVLRDKTRGTVRRTAGWFRPPARPHSRPA